MAWELPISTDGCINDTSAISQIISVINSAITHYTNWLDYHAPLGGLSISAISTITADSCHNSRTIYEAIENRLAVMLGTAIADPTAIANDDTIPDVDYPETMGDHTYQQFDGTHYTWPDLVTQCNVHLATADDMTDSTTQTTINKIPFTGGAFGLDTCLTSTRLNQYWACCKLLQSVCWWAFCNHARAAAGVLLDSAESYYQGGTDTTCALAKTDLENNFSPGWAADDTYLPGVELYYSESGFPNPAWDAYRQRGKFKITNLPTGTGFDITRFIFRSRDPANFGGPGRGYYDSDTPTKNEHTLYDKTVTSNNASTTSTSGLFGDYSYSPSTTYICTGFDQEAAVSYLAVWLIKHSISDPA